MLNRKTLTLCVMFTVAMTSTGLAVAANRKPLELRAAAVQALGNALDSNDTELVEAIYDRLESYARER